MLQKLLLTVLLSLATTVYADNNHSRTRTAGDIIQIAVPLTAAAMTKINNDPVGEQQFVAGFFTNLALTQTIKITTDRPRPNGGSKSFPSGHTSAAFQGAAFIHRRYGIEYAWPGYALGTFVGYSRYYCKCHNIADVAAGAALGTATSFYFTSERPTDIVVVPMISRENIGFVMTKAF